MTSTSPSPIDQLFVEAEAHSHPIRLALQNDGFIYKDVTRFANPNGLNCVTFAFTHPSSTFKRRAKIMYFSYNTTPNSFRYRIEINGTDDE